MTTTAKGDPPTPAPLLGPVLGTLPPDLLHTEVLRRLGPTDLASLAGASHGCAAAVASTALMQWAKRAKFAHHVHYGYFLPPLCLKEACSHAACCGNRVVLEWLHNTGCPWDSSTCAVAAGGGHLEVLQWARAYGCPWGATTCASAAQFGHLRLLQWAREHYCLWNWETPALAAFGGHLVVLQWLQENGFPWEEYVCEYAARSGQLEVLQWMLANDATSEAWSENRVRRWAGGPKGQEVLTWLDGLSAP
jgi:hypothetical protein